MKRLQRKLRILNACAILQCPSRLNCETSNVNCKNEEALSSKKKESTSKHEEDEEKRRVD